MNSLKSRANRTLVYFLSALLAFNPMLASAQIVVDESANADKKASLNTAANGVDIIDIANPSERGVSHNQFSTFNVSERGVILNNSNEIVNTQLGGYINGNANLAGEEARLILNEVTGKNRSSLRGYTEIAGQQAEYVLANPYGITCNGCGFINTPKVTLATGRPEMVDGKLKNLTVTGGNFVVDGLGLNAADVDHLDILTRAARINAALHAKHLRVVTGTNRVDYQSGAVTPITSDDTEKPEFGLDVAALGGMYANAITLMGTEQGVGVRAAGAMAASAGDLVITAKGDIVLNDASASDRMALSTTQNLTALGNLHADSMHASAGRDMVLEGQTIAAQRQINLSAANLESASMLSAGFDATGKAVTGGLLSINASGSVTNTGHILSTGRVAIDAQDVMNRSEASIKGDMDVAITAENLLNSQGVIASGGTGNIDIEDVLDNSGGHIFSNAGTLNITARNLVNAAGGVVTHAGEQLVISSESLNNQSGQIASGGAATFNVTDMDNDSGQIYGTAVSFFGGNLSNSGGVIEGDEVGFDLSGNLTNGYLGGYNGWIATLGNSFNSLLLKVDGTLDNSGGVINTNADGLEATIGTFANNGGKLVHAGEELLAISATIWDNSGGLTDSDGHINITTDRLANNTGELVAAGNIAAQVTNSISNRSGVIDSAQTVTLSAGSLDNSGGTVASAGIGSTAIEVAGVLDNTDGLILSNGQRLNLAAEAIVNLSTDSTRGRIHHTGSDRLILQVNELSNTGEIASTNVLDIAGKDAGTAVAQITNTDGGAIFADTLSINANSVTNAAGAALEADAMVLTAHTALRNNTGAYISAYSEDASRAELEIAAHNFDNNGGITQTNAQNVNIAVTRFQNNGGSVVHAGSGLLTLSAESLLDNSGGEISSNGGLSLRASNLNNSNNGRILGSGNIGLGIAGLMNNAGGYLDSGQVVTINAGALDNTAGTIYSVGNGVTTWMMAGGIDNTSGIIVSNADDFSLVADSLVNRGETATIHHAGTGTLSITLADALVNDAGEIASAAEVQLKANSVSNINSGRLFASTLVLDAVEVDNSAAAVIEADSLLINVTDRFTNTAGGILSAYSQTGEGVFRIGNSEGISALLFDNSGGIVRTNHANADISVGDFVNADGSLIHTGSGTLALSANDWNNSSGFVDSKGEIKLSAGSFNNNLGQLLAGNGLLAVIANRLNNSGGLIDSGANFNLTAGNIDNIAGSIFGAGTSNSEITSGGRIDNTDGWILSNGDLLTISGASLINRQSDGADGGVINHAGSTGLHLNITNAVSNGGEIGSASLLRIAGAATDPAIVTVDNRGGNLFAETVQITAADLDNTAGNLQGQGVDLAITGNLTNGSQDGVRGRITAYAETPDSASLVMDVNGHFNNSGGVTQTNAQNADISAQIFTNAAGEVKHVGNGALSLVVDNTLNNNSGHLTSTGRLQAAAGNISTSSGSIVALGRVDLNSSNAINNTSGLIEGGNGLALTAAGGKIINQQGDIRSFGNGRVTLSGSAGIDNRNGSIYMLGGSNAVVLNANAHLNNQDGSIQHGGTGQFTVEADLIDNITVNGLNASDGTRIGASIGSNGALLISDFNDLINRSQHASLKSTISAEHMELASNRNGAEVINAKGVLFASGDNSMIVNVQTLNNSNGMLSSVGDITVDANAVQNVGGIVQSEQAVTLNLPNFNMSNGTFNAGEDLIINTFGNVVNNSGNELKTSGDLIINTTGNFTNSGRISTLGTIGLNSTDADFINNAGGEVTAGEDLLLTFYRIINNGTLTAANDIHFNAQSFTNGGIAAAGNNLTVATSQSITNNNLLFAGNNMWLYGGSSVTNNLSANIYALNNIVIAANDNNERLQSFENISATVESSGGSLSVMADVIDNRMSVLRISPMQKYDEDETIGQGASGFRNETTIYYREEVIEKSPEAQMIAAGDLLLTGGSINNEYSILAAGTDLTINGSDLTNEAVDLYKYSTTSIHQGTRTCRSNGDCEWQYTDTYTATEPEVWKTFSSLIMAGESIQGNLSGRISNITANIDELLSSRDVDTSASGVNLAEQPEAATNQADKTDITNSISAGTAIVREADSNAGNSVAESIQPTDVQAASTASGSDTAEATVDDELIAAVSASESDNVNSSDGRMEAVDGPVEVVDIYNPVADLHLPQDKGLFVVSPEPEADYLVETNPALTSYLSFISSDYMLNELGYDPSDLAKRLGDGFYETQLVREAIWNTRGQRFLRDAQGVAFTSDIEQFKYLMNNAIASSKELNLTPGIALSGEQVARLTHDIIWLEEQEVQGQTVLVPIYYATTANGTNFRNGAVIAGTDINLNADDSFTNSGTINGTRNVSLSTEQTLVNTGLVAGNSSVIIDAGSITNQRINNERQGIIESLQGSVDLLTTVGDMDNIDGSIRGQSVTLESLRGSIANSGTINAERNLVAVARRDISNSIGEHSGSIGAGRDLTLVAREGSIRNNAVVRTEGDNTFISSRPEFTAGGNMHLKAGTDIEMTAARVDAGGNLVADAGRDILLTSAAQESSWHSTAFGNDNIVERLINIGTEIFAGGSVSFNADRDFRVVGSRVNADGAIDVVTGRDFHVETVANRTHEERGNADNKTIDTTIRHVSTGFTAGGDLSIDAGRDANLIGSDVQSGGDISLHAARDTNLVAVNDSTYHYKITTKDKSFGRKKVTVDETRTETVVGGSLQAGGDVLINARKAGDLVITQGSGKVNIVGGIIDAGLDVIVSADEDINITGSSYKELDYHNTSKKGFAGLSSKKKGEVQDNVNLHAASIASQGDIELISGNNLAMAGVDIVADGDVNLEAVDELLLNAGEVITQTEQWSESSGLFTGGSFYASSEKRAGEGVTAAQASTITAGGTVTGRAGSAKIIGSDVHGEQGVDIRSDIGDTVVTAATTTRDSFSYEKDLSVSMGGALDTLSRPDQIVENDDGRLKVSLAKATYDKVETTTHQTEMTGSNITSGGGVTLGAEESVLIEGSNVAADLDENGTGDVNLMAKKDVTIKEATELFEQETKETHGEAEVSFVVQHQAAEVVKAALAVKEAAKKLKQAKKDYKQYEKDLDNLKNTLAALEADYENQTPGVNYQDILELRELVEDVEGDKDWYVASVALAAANVAAKTTALVQQTAAAAASTATYGFNAGVQLDIDGTKSKESIHQTTSVASNVSGQNINIQTGGGHTAVEDTQTTIQGSHLQATNSLNINTGELNVLASRDKLETESETQHAHVSAQVTVYGAAGGASLSGSYDRSKTSTSQTTYSNSTLTADNIQLSTTGDTTIRGGNVHADTSLTADIGGDLTVESVQNRSRSRNNAMGISAGTSFGGSGDLSGVNGGLNASNGMSASKQTVLSSLTSGGTADITVGDTTQITGALIATIDEDGNDLGNLNLDTGTLTFTDLRNSSTSNQRSAGTSTSINAGDTSATEAAQGQTLAQDTKGGPLQTGTTNITYSNTSHNEASKALATLGNGTITVRDETGSDDLQSLNRDVTSTTKNLWNVDQQEGNIDLTVDHRMLSKEGREEIRQQLDQLPENLETVANNLLDDIETLSDSNAGERKARNEAIMAAARKRLEGLSPEEQERIMKMVGVFIDGTGNDKYKDAADGKETNVAILYELYDQETDPLYYPGVATDWYSSVLCGITGCGGQARIGDALEDIGATWEGGDEVLVIDVTGFSRGSAQSLELVNTILEDGIPGVPQDQIVINGAYLFDTVSSTGMPGNNIDASYDLESPTVVPVFHATAGDEKRDLFDLQSQLNPDGTSPENVTEQTFFGAHSDVGGGYAPGEDGKENTLSTIPLQWMHQNAVENGAPFAPIPEQYQVPPELQKLYEAAQSGDEEAMRQIRDNYIHDSRYPWEQWLEDSERTIYYPNGD